MHRPAFQDATGEVCPMYLPKHFEETRVDVLHELIHAHPLGTLVTLMPGGLDAGNHIPFEVAPSPGAARDLARPRRPRQSGLA